MPSEAETLLSIAEGFLAYNETLTRIAQSLDVIADAITGTLFVADADYRRKQQ